MKTITDRAEIKRLRETDPGRNIHEETIELIGWNLCVIRRWDGPVSGWTTHVSDGDGAAAGNIVQEETVVVAQWECGYHVRQLTRHVAVNQNHVAHGPWTEVPLTWGN